MDFYFTYSLTDVVCEQSVVPAKNLLWQICHYRRDGYLCDTMIVTDNGRLLAHSLMLTAASPMFKAALKVTDRPREHIIVIPGVNSSVMKTILQLMYADEIVQTPKDMTDVTSLMSELQLMCLRQTEDVAVGSQQCAVHARKLLRQICHYQHDGYLCDTVIVTDDGRLLAHSLVLAAASPMFKAALKVTDRPREHIIVIPGVKSSAMKTVLQLMYADEIVPMPKDMTDVTSLMSELQLLCLQHVEYVADFPCISVDGL